jgi:hypothetical protein
LAEPAELFCAYANKAKQLLRKLIFRAESLRRRNDVSDDDVSDDDVSDDDVSDDDISDDDVSDDDISTLDASNARAFFQC